MCVFFFDLSLFNYSIMLLFRCTLHRCCLITCSFSVHLRRQKLYIPYTITPGRFRKRPNYRVIFRSRGHVRRKNRPPLNPSTASITAIFYPRETPYSISMFLSRADSLKLTMHIFLRCLFNDIPIRERNKYLRNDLSR